MFTGSYQTSRDNQDRYSTRRDNRDKGPNRNQMIRASEVLLIDENNEKVGVVPIQVAQARANEIGVDLVEVSTNTTPPVCRIMDYSKFVYEQNKKQKDSKKKTKQKEMKEFRFTPVIAQGDIDFRVKRSKEFLDKGHSVRITMFRKGRQSRELAEEKLREILTYFDGYSTIEPEISREGRRSFITYKANAKAKNKQNSSEKVEENKPEGEQKS